MRTFENRRKVGQGSPLGREISTQTWDKKIWVFSHYKPYLDLEYFYVFGAK